jgi:hypothetical protein
MTSESMWRMKVLTPPPDDSFCPPHRRPLSVTVVYRQPLSSTHAARSMRSASSASASPASVFVLWYQYSR